MNRSLTEVLLFLLALGMVLQVPAANAATAAQPQVSVTSQYIVNRYGYAVINESVTMKNNYSSALSIPDIQLGFENLSSFVTSFGVTGSGYSVSSSTGPQGTVYAVSAGGGSLAAGANSSFSFKAYVDGITKTTSNNTLSLLVLNRPFLSTGVISERLRIKMPDFTQATKSPAGYTLNVAGANVTYSQNLGVTSSPQALVESLEIQATAGMDFHPVVVYSASREIVVSSNGSPMVKDSIYLQNLGKTQLSTLTVAPLTTPNAQITVLPSSTPPLSDAANVLMTSGGISLSNNGVSLSVDPNANLTIVYEYPLAKQYYVVSGGAVNVTIPLAPPITAYVNSYTIGLSLPPGVRGSSSGKSMASVAPSRAGTISLSYGLTVGWAVDSGVPLASSAFVILLVALFAARMQQAPEEEEEEETATERSSDMVKAFEEKTSLINTMFDEIPKTDPNELNKAYFDELRGRLDAFRSRALQRLNEVKQKSTTQKFFELLGQIHETERELDRAAKDMLNLYEQFYTRRMRREVFDRLLPSYRKRLEKALDRLSDELNTAQRESKLL